MAEDEVDKWQVVVEIVINNTVMVLKGSLWIENKRYEDQPAISTELAKKCEYTKYK
jgi:hypothetical protein